MWMCPVCKFCKWLERHWHHVSSSASSSSASNALQENSFNSFNNSGHRIPPEKKTPLFSVNVWLWEWMAKNVYGLINFHAKSDSSVIIAIFIEREERVHNEPSSKVNVWRMKIAPDRRGAARRVKKISLSAKIDDKTTQYSNRFL